MSQLQTRLGRGKETYSYQSMTQTDPEAWLKPRLYEPVPYSLYTSPKHTIEYGFDALFGFPFPIQGLLRSLSQCSIDPINSIEGPSVLEDSSLSEPILFFQDRDDNMIPCRMLRILLIRVGYANERMKLARARLVLMIPLLCIRCSALAKTSSRLASRLPSSGQSVYRLSALLIGSFSKRYVGNLRC
jgi:hypothetical protein